MGLENSVDSQWIAPWWLLAPLMTPTLPVHSESEERVVPGPQSFLGGPFLNAYASHSSSAGAPSLGH